jgi:hypothetical protein
LATGKARACESALLSLVEETRVIKEQERLTRIADIRELLVQADGIWHAAIGKAKADRVKHSAFSDYVSWFYPELASCLTLGQPQQPARQVVQRPPQGRRR